MLKHQNIALLLVLLVGSYSAFGQDNKKPAIISSASGAVNNTYSLVQTTIYRNPQDPDKTKNIITRAQLDLLGPAKQASKPLELKLETPVPPVTIETYGATKIVDKIGQLVGSIGSIPVPGQGGAAAVTDPKAVIAGKAIQTAAELANVAIKITEGELTKLYENQETRINLLEILPVRYYTIDQSTGKVNVTDDFLRDFSVYTKTLEQYLQAFEEYRKYENAYTQMVLKLRAVDPAGKKQDAWKIVRDYDTNQVQPRLKVKNQLEDQLARLFPLYRIAIMASPSVPGNTCGTAGKGPWELYIIYYLGARQTNQIAVKYCVANVQDFQRLMTEVVTNSIIQVNLQYGHQVFQPGGIRLIGQSNATFAQARGIGEGNFNASSTEIFNWFTEMITSPAGDSVDAYLVPFNVYDVRRSIAQQASAKPDDAELQALLKSVDNLANVLPLAAQEQTPASKTKEAQQIALAENAAKKLIESAADIARVVETTKKTDQDQPVQTETQTGTQADAATQTSQTVTTSTQTDAPAATPESTATQAGTAQAP